MSKRGDPYLRTLLIYGARALIRHAPRRSDTQGWLIKWLGRRPKKVAIVALANKNARILWALLAHDRPFEAHRLVTGRKTRQRCRSLFLFHSISIRRNLIHHDIQ